MRYQPLRMYPEALRMYPERLRIYLERLLPYLSRSYRISRPSGNPPEPR
jgi:hypothetical protein